VSKQRTRICVEGWYYLLVLAFIVGGAMMREINLLLFVAGILIGPLAISWRLVNRVLQQLDVIHKLPTGIGAGEMLVAEVAVTNERRRMDAWGITVEDRIVRCDANGDGQEQGETVRVFFPHIATQQTCVANYQGRIERRGRYAVGPLEMSTRFPLRLLRRSVTWTAKKYLYVFPRMGRLKSQWLQMVQPGRVGSRRSQQRQGMVEGEFHSLRDWRGGDSKRWIHWRTSARRNKLSVKQFERQQNQNMALLIDLWLPANPNDEDLRRVEEVISFAATAVANHCRRGSSRLLMGIAAARLETVAGVTSTGLLEECLEELAVAVPTSADRLPELLDTVLSAARPESRIVVLSTRQTELSDTERFEEIWQKPRERATLGRVMCLAADDPEFKACFELENSPAIR
jgi:uncharacterized protein (DUF58 family)